MKHLVFLVCSVIATAQQPPWRELPATGEGPSGRVDGAIAYDEHDKRIYMFGGRDTRPANDLWAYSIEEGRWTQLRASGGPPAARFGHTLLLDAQRRRLLLFGGQASGFFSDTWAYDIARNTWQQIAPGGSGPNERYGHSAVLDPTRDRMIISHGFTDEGRFDDTWALNLSTNRWQNISPNGERPLRRCLHHAVLDMEGNQMLLYGGCASGFGPCPLGDLWSFDLTTHRWTERSAGLKPPERQWYGMSFDTTRRRLVLFAGAGDTGNLNDTWEYDPARSQWIQMRFSPAPTARSRHEAAFAPGLGTVFFGGNVNGGLSNQLLLLASEPAPSTPRFSSAAVNAFSGDASPLVPGGIVSIYGEALGPVFGTSAAADANGNLPRSIAGSSVAVNGLNAPLLYAQSTQLNFQVPYELAGTTQAEIIVTYNGQRSAPLNLSIQQHRPGIHPSAFRIGDVIVMFVTGAGQFTPNVATGALVNTTNLPSLTATVELLLAGQPAIIEFTGHAPQTAGVLQINARLPDPAANGPIEATLTVGGTSTTATLTLR
ncbi:MAG: kelch repeat-containing protein [Bryobacteraceae bacterium]